MSVAERLSSEDAAPMPQAPHAAIDNILRLALNGGGPRHPAGTGVRRNEPDFGKAAELLDRATDAIATLTARTEELEHAKALQEEVFADKLRAAQDEAAEWERRAKIMKGQLQDCESRLSEQQARIDSLTFRAESAEARALTAEQTAAESRKQSQLYHDKIMSTLGKAELVARLR